MIPTKRRTASLRLDFLLALFLGAGLALTGCGDDDTATTPAPAPPPPAATPEPEPPAPEAPAAPTGLMVSATTTDSVTWTWNAVEGAVGYAVQVSMDEMFDDSDAITMTTETSHTQSGLVANTSVYARVAAAAGTMDAPVQSAWTTHVTGMSAMPPPPPPPPAPDPVTVSFMVPEGKLPLLPDSSTDRAKAMATVNRDITVTSNTTAIIEPMGFADGASPVSLNEGDNTPFKFVDWKALQSQVVGDGVTFRITRQTMGANQEMAPTGDVAYVTCGPFQCVEGMDAPAITVQNSAVCAHWHPSLKLVPGVIDPQRMEGSTSVSQGSGTNPPPGFDLGWVYTANTTFTVKHDFGIFSAPSGEDVPKGSGVPLPAGRAPHPTATAPKQRRDITDSPNGATAPSASVRTVIDVDQAPAGTDGCYPTIIGTNPGLYLRGAGRLQKPFECFRLSNAAAYLRNYKVTLTPKNASVSWGNIPWDSFKGLSCPASTFTAADQLDVCELLDEEIEILNRVQASARTIQPGGSGPFKLEGIDLYYQFVSRNRKRWTQLLYFDDTTASPTNDVQNLYHDWASTDRQASPGVLAGRQVSTNGPRNRWIQLLDADNLPTTKYGDLGDLGYVDAGDATGNNPAGGDDKPDNFPTRTCTARDGGKARSSSTKRDGTLCIAEDVKIPTSVTFTDGMGFGCTVKKEYILTCQWDPRGGFDGVGRRAPTGLDAAPLPTALDATNGYKFLACKVALK